MNGLLGVAMAGSVECSRLIANAVIYYNVLLLSRGTNRKSHTVTKRPPTSTKRFLPIGGIITSINLLEALGDIQRINPRRTPDGVLDSARDVHRQLVVDADRTAPRAVGQMSNSALRERLLRRYNISSRMADILLLAIQGRSNKEISIEVRLAERTVKNQLIKLYGIVGVRNRGTTSRVDLVVRCMADIALVSTTKTANTTKTMSL